MNGESFLFQAFVFLAAAVVAVPIAQRFGLGSVLGYLAAGVAIGPWGMGWVGDDAEKLRTFAEFGVVLMLFLVGLELRPALLWQMRTWVVGLGGLQVVLSGAALGGAVAWSTGLPVREAMALGGVLALSSTAIVLQSLAEQGQLRSQGGQACFSVLLFQDIAVIPILAILPLLAAHEGSAGAAPHHHGAGALEHLPAGWRAVATVAAIAAVVVVGRFVLRHVFRAIARTRLREVFAAAALLLVVGVALLMETVGLSPALGTFLAGVVLAENEFRHQLEADIEPFKGLLLGLFFITVGAGLEWGLVAAAPGAMAGSVLGLLAVKFAVLVALGAAFGFPWRDTFLLAFALAQAGEFCFVLLQFGLAEGVFTSQTARFAATAVALSMAAAPLLLTLNHRVVQPAFCRSRANTREPDAIDTTDNAVILAGFGRFGHVVARLLRANGVGCTVLDDDADQVELLRRFGLKSYYGNALRVDLLHAAGAARAKLFVAAIDQPAKTLELVQTVQREFPHLHILARADSRQTAYELIRLGVKDVFRETLGSALDLGEAALCALGFRAHQAHRAARLFRFHDEASVRDMAEVSGEDTPEYISRAQKHVANLDAVLAADAQRFGRPWHDATKPERGISPN